MKVLIVDDEPLAIDRLADLLRNFEEVEVVGSSTNAARALDDIAALKPDLVLLDIQMPGGSGMALAADLPPEGRPEIIFVTAFENFAADAFEVDAADYLLKPVRFDRLRQAITRTRRRIDLCHSAAPAAEQDDARYVQEFWVAAGSSQIRVGVDQIDWIEAAKDYVIFHTSMRSFLHRISMNALEACIDSRKLMRVHRSAFVRLSQIERLDRPARGVLNLVLRDGAIVQVGPSYVKAVQEQLALRSS